MCGRYELNETPANLGSRYRIELGDLEFAQNADVRPTTTNPVILLLEGKHIASMRKWGIVPFWAKNPKGSSTPFNARSEEAYAKPMFRGPFEGKRCLVPATAFFEWGVIEGLKKKQKIRIARADGDLVTLAGLYDLWMQVGQYDLGGGCNNKRGCKCETRSLVVRMPGANAIQFVRGESQIKNKPDWQ